MERVRNEQTIYSTAVYCRLSKDDEQAGESVSIETQKMMLTDFCHERGFSIYEIYADDGYSGLNFNRPAFTRLLEDIDSGKVNLVITKDLSRLGRDYIQTGYYTDVYFSRKRVRYIAVNDGIDTNRDDNDIAPFKNILNDMYAKDLSRKGKVGKTPTSLQRVLYQRTGTLRLQGRPIKPKPLNRRRSRRRGGKRNFPSCPCRTQLIPNQQNTVPKENHHTGCL